MPISPIVYLEAGAVCTEAEQEDRLMAGPKHRFTDYESPTQVVDQCGRCNVKGYNYAYCLDCLLSFCPSCGDGPCPWSKEHAVEPTAGLEQEEHPETKPNGAVFGASVKMAGGLFAARVQISVGGSTQSWQRYPMCDYCGHRTQESCETCGKLVCPKCDRHEGEPEDCKDWR